MWLSQGQALQQNVRMPLKAVFFDVGETLVDEERWWRELAERSGLQPHVVWAALGVTIARGEEHDALWGHLGIEKPDGWWHGLTYELDDLYPDAVDCLRELRALGLRVGIVGNQTEELERWAREAALPADVVSSSVSLGVRKPYPRFFEHVAELAELRAGGGRVRRRSRRQRRSPGCGRRPGGSPRAARSVGTPAADPAGGRARDR